MRVYYSNSRHKPRFHSKNFPQELGTLGQYSVCFHCRNQDLKYSCKQRFRGQAHEGAVAQRRTKSAEIERTLKKQIQKHRSSKLNRTSDENEQTHISYSRRTCTEDPTSETKATFHLFRPQYLLRSGDVPPWIRTHDGASGLAERATQLTVGVSQTNRLVFSALP